MMIETLEQMRARIDQCGVEAEIVDFVVDIAAEIEKRPAILGVHLMSLAEAAARIGCKKTALRILTARSQFLEESME